MTVAQMVPLQTAIFTVVSAAVPGMAVHDYVQTNPPAEFIRLDAFNMTGINFKSGEAGFHSFEVHFFSRPGAEGVTSRGTKRAKEVIAQIHAALMAATVLTTKLNQEYVQVETGEDGTTAHARARYTITL
jgi:hypothetical protein